MSGGCSDSIMRKQGSWNPTHSRTTIPRLPDLQPLLVPHGDSAGAGHAWAKAGCTGQRSGPHPLSCPLTCTQTSGSSILGRGFQSWGAMFPEPPGNFFSIPLHPASAPVHRILSVKSSVSTRATCSSPFHTCSSSPDQDNTRNCLAHKKLMEGASPRPLVPLGAPGTCLDITTNAARFLDPSPSPPHLGGRISRSQVPVRPHLLSSPLLTPSLSLFLDD